VKVSSEDTTVADLLVAHFLLVPRFQRPYEWTKGEVEDFWEDVTQATKDYFIGSMVIFPSLHGMKGLVDGQQRITTITLLLCVLRDALRHAGSVDEADGLQNLVERRSVLDNKQHFVLQTDEDRPYLRYVQSGHAGDAPTTSSAEVRLQAAHEELRSRVESLGSSKPGKRPQLLLQLRDKVMQLRLISVEVDSEDDATVIFQTLNSRGRDLEAADLVKSHLLSLLKAKNAAHDPARTKWNGILTTFNESQADLPMDRFLLHSWLSRYDYLAQADLGKQTRKKVKKTGSGTTVAANDFLDRLVTDARLYRELHEPEFRSPWQQEEKAVYEAFVGLLQRFRVRQPLPWLLALWRQYDGKGLRLKDLLPAVQAVERFHFLATAVTNQPSSGGVSKMYASHAQKLTDAVALDDRRAVLAQLRTRLTDPARLPTLGEFSAGFAEVRSSRLYTQQQRLALYILQRLHLHEASSAPDLSELTVEHLDPQGNGRSASVADVARLGNLLLLPRAVNDQLGSRSFSQKRDILRQAAAAGTYIDPFVLEQEQWTAEQISERTRRLAETSYTQVWSLSETHGKV